jgi:hypothetical protein
LIVGRLRSAGIDISLSGVNETVMKVLVRTHLFNKIGADHIYPTLESALRQIHPPLHPDEEERKRCPLGVTAQPKTIRP